MDLYDGSPPHVVHPRHGFVVLGLWAPKCLGFGFVGFCVAEKKMGFGFVGSRRGFFFGFVSL